MTMKNRFVRCASAAALTAALAVAGMSPAFAGEVTGNGKDIDMHANSLCAFSGQNDTPNGLWLPIGPGGALVQVDPGGQVQSYGYFKAQMDFGGPSSDPAVKSGFSFPGNGCNPNWTGTGGE
jgi:hypothetical protein